MENYNEKICDLFNVEMYKVEMLLEPWELAAVLRTNKYKEDITIILENMLEYYVEEEKYSYCCVIRDEINRRKKLKKPLN